MGDIRADLYTKVFGSNPEDLQNMYLHLEKSRFQEPKNKEFAIMVNTFKPDDNYDLIIGKKGVFGVKHVAIDNGDVFIGEMMPNPYPVDYIDAKKFISETCNEVCIIAKLYDKYEKFGYRSFSKHIINAAENCEEFQMKTKLSHFQRDLMQQIADRFKHLLPNLTFQQIQIYTHKSHQRIPVALSYPYTDEENSNKIKKAGSNPSLGSIIENSTTLLFDIMPYSLPNFEHKILVYCLYLNQSYESCHQFHRLLPENATIRELDCEIKNEVMSIISRDKSIDMTDLEETKYLILAHPQNVVISELDQTSVLSAHAKNPGVIICIRALLNPETKLRNDLEIKRVNVYSYVKGTESYGPPQVVYIKRNTTCKELIQTLLQNKEQKSRVMLTNYYNYGESHEYKPARPLEDSDELFCQKYEEKVLAIELPNPIVVNRELRFKTNES